MSQVFRLDRRAVGKISLLTAVFYFSAYFYRFFTLGYAHDSLLIDQSIDMTWQIQLGRFLQPVYLLFRGDIAVPYLIGLRPISIWLPPSVWSWICSRCLPPCLSRWSAWRCAPIRR